MTIQITVIDPAKTPRAELLHVIAFLNEYTGGAVATPAAPDLPTLAPADNPATGTSPDDAFGGDPVAAFGDVGNVAAAGSPAISDPAIAFSPPAAPSAPSVAVATAGAVDLDKNGLPWDGRIHAGTKRKNADGTWTAKRGVDEATVAQVEAQLRGVMAIPAPAPVATSAAPLPPAAVGAPVTPPVPPVPPQPPAAPAPITAPSAPVTIPTAPAGADFATTAKLVGELIGANRLTQQQLEGIVGKYGVAPPQFGLLFNRPDLVPAVHADIVAAAGV